MSDKSINVPADEVHQAIREVGGIVHSDGNIFFTNKAMFLAACRLASPSAPEAQGEPMTMAHAAQIKGALDAMQEMWDHLRHKGLNDILMLEYSNALKVLEDDFISRLPIDAALSSHGDKGGSK